MVAAVVSSDNKAYPTRVKLVYGCFGLGCGNIMLIVVNFDLDDLKRNYVMLTIFINKH